MNKPPRIKFSINPTTWDAYWSNRDNQEALWEYVITVNPDEVDGIKESLIGMGQEKLAELVDIVYQTKND